jgi:glycosyltransferase involved in cell wall biosynthesis
MIGNLVEAMTFVTDEVALVLVGRMEPAFTRWCADYCRRSGSGHRIIHIEHVPYGEELFALCAGANVGVMFVRGDCRNNIFNVTAANKLFEYMMMGVPVLTVDFAAHREFVEGKGIGRCVNAEDPESIGRVIMEMFRDREATAAMGARARHLAEQEFNWEEQSRKLIAAYENLILGRASTYGTQGTPGS